MIKADISAFENFRRKIEKLSIVTNDELALAVAEKGSEIAKNYYSGNAGISVNAESVGNGIAKIISEGKEVLFEEYGTGWVGEGTYEGNLPTDTITFESAGKQRSTQGWEYHYQNEDTKKPKDNPTFWYYNGEKHTGFPAQAQMWRTSRDLKDGKGKKAIKDYLDSKLGG